MGKIRRLSVLLCLVVILILVSCNKVEVKEIEKTEEAENAYEISDSLNQHEVNIETNLLEETPAGNHPPKLSIIIDDFGNYNNFMLDSLLVKFGELPSEVAFAILPNLPYSEFVMEYFQHSGRELLLHTPMEALNDKINAGEIVIEIQDDPITIINKLNSMHGQLNKVVGLNNHMGSKATSDKEVMTSLLEWCKENNLFFVDSATSPKSLAYDLAKEIGVPTARRNIFLDVPDASIETVNNYLNKMKKYFEARKDILVITHASSFERLKNLSRFIKESQQLGYKLVPLSDFLIYPDLESIQPSPILSGQEDKAVL